MSQQDLATLQERQLLQELGFRFGDAVNRGDSADFGSLWTDDCLWEIGTPWDMQVRGRQEVVNLFDSLIDTWTFFIQLATPGIVSVQGNTANGRTYLHETGLKKDGTTFRVWGVYHDRFEKLDGQWFFSERRFEFGVMDAPTITPDYTADRWNRK